MNKQKVWFVTGASKGLGLALVKELLATGYRVAATSRSKNDLITAVGESQHFLPVETDLTSEVSVAAAVKDTIDRFGRIDIVVNNAGYSQIGTLEELTDTEVRGNFDVNVFGMLNVIRKAVPYLRLQQSGHVFNIASIGGLTGNFPAFGIYCATKFAVAGLTEALAEEMNSFGIRTTLIYPGYFRTGFLSKESVKTPQTPIDAYSSARAIESAHLNEINGNQPNDPEKAAKLMIELSEMKNPPVHFLMGKDAYELAQNKIQLLKETFEEWKDYTISTKF
jgi:NAD(P)-dependent dehydrogenase (short-subunit alcohol dehydrogenase family)